MAKKKTGRSGKGTRSRATPESARKKKILPSRVPREAPKPETKAAGKTPKAKTLTASKRRAPRPKKTSGAPARTTSSVPRKIADVHPPAREASPAVSKFQLTGPKYFFRADVPDSYNETYMRAIPRDPEWLFVYWEISAATRDSIRSMAGETSFGSAKKLLRLCDVTGVVYDGSNAQRYDDIEINEFANNWYLHVPEPGKTYIIECGFLTPDGKFLIAARSNAVEVPRQGPSAAHDKDWTIASGDEIMRMSAANMARPFGASEKRFGGAAERMEGPGWPLGAGSGSGMFGAPSSRV
jgi:hypothetical protein